MLRALGSLVLLLIVLAPGFAPAQPLQQGVPASAVLVLNQERLYTSSQYGQRVTEELEAAGQDLAAENREIEAALTEEELDLTDRRAGMDPLEFRALADAFDTRVEAIRTEQEAKARALTQAADAARQQFFELSIPVLLDLVRERGAAAILDTRAVILSAGSVDITDAALERVDRIVGRGGEAPLLDLEAATEIPTEAPAE